MFIVGKVHKKDDFTEQNLKYFKHSAWNIKKDTYEKVRTGNEYFYHRIFSF